MFPLPGFAVKLAFGEMGDEMLLASQKVIPTRLEASEYAFEHRTVAAAMDAAVGD